MIGMVSDTLLLANDLKGFEIYEHMNLILLTSYQHHD